VADLTSVPGSAFGENSDRRLATAAARASSETPAAPSRASRFLNESEAHGKALARFKAERDVWREVSDGGTALEGQDLKSPGWQPRGTVSPSLPKPRRAGPVAMLAVHRPLCVHCRRASREHWPGLAVHSRAFAAAQRSFARLRRTFVAH